MGGDGLLFRYLFVVILVNSLVVLFLSECYGRMLLPWWSWDFFISFYWLTAVFVGDTGSILQNSLIHSRISCVL